MFDYPDIKNSKQMQDEYKHMEDQDHSDPYENENFDDYKEDL